MKKFKFSSVIIMLVLATAIFKVDGISEIREGVYALYGFSRLMKLAQTVKRTD